MVVVGDPPKELRVGCSHETFRVPPASPIRRLSTPPLVIGLSDNIDLRLILDSKKKTSHFSKLHFCIAHNIVKKLKFTTIFCSIKLLISVNMLRWKWYQSTLITWEEQG